METTRAWHPHNPAQARRLHPPWLGSVLGQRQVCPSPVVVIDVLRQDPPQMSFADHHHMVKAFPSDGDSLDDRKNLPEAPREPAERPGTALGVWRE